MQSMHIAYHYQVLDNEVAIAMKRTITELMKKRQARRSQCKYVKVNFQHTDVIVQSCTQKKS